MRNLRAQSDNELSLMVFNTETLYKMRHTPNLLCILVDLFDFRHAQADVLIRDLWLDFSNQKIAELTK